MLPSSKLYTERASGDPEKRRRFIVSLILSDEEQDPTRWPRYETDCAGKIQRQFYDDIAHSVNCKSQWA
jgi:hypothetical protein